MRSRCLLALGLLPLALVACEGGTGPSPAVSGTTGAPPANASGGAGQVPQAAGFTPLTPCEPVLEQRVTRLSDRHLSKALAELLGIQAPAIETGALSEDAFIPGKAATVNGAVASKLQDVAELAASAGTTPGQAIASCAGVEQDCARAFIEDFASRAFRRPLRDQERADLLAVWSAGRDSDGSYAGGVSLVIETVLQSPSFIYLAELGAPNGAHFTLSGYETAAKLGIFLRDGLPDAELWAAAKSGLLDSDAGIAAQVERLLADPAVKENLSDMFARFFQLHLIPEVERPDASWPALAEAMHVETDQLISSVLWQRTGTLSELLTTREATVTPELAVLYGVPAPTVSATVQLPSEQRTGILTRAGFMAARAEAETTSVVFRGLMVARGLLCIETPSPPASVSAQIDALKAEVLTERQRAEKRAATQPCGGCHAYFDPFGITFENYDPMGKWRTSEHSPTGEVPINAAQDLSISDISGHFESAVQLSEKLAQSPAARECMSRQIAAYAIGEKLSYQDACTVAAVAQKFETSGGDLRSLIKEVALWPALRTRKAVTQ